MLFHKLENLGILKPFSRRNVHEIVEVFVDDVVGSDRRQPAYEEGDVREIFKNPEDRGVNSQKHRQGEPVHRDMNFVRVFFFTLSPFVGVRFVFVDLMMYDGVSLKGGFDKLWRVKQVLMESPFKETSIEEEKYEGERFAGENT